MNVFLFGGIGGRLPQANLLLIVIAAAIVVFVSVMVVYKKITNSDRKYAKKTKHDDKTINR